VGQRSSRNVVPAYQVISKESDIGMAASVKDVAALAGVSVGTVSNVINRPDKVSASAASRVHAAIDQLGFVRNDAARQLRAGRSSTIGLVVLDVRNPFFTDLARAAEDRAANDGFSLMLGNSDERADREAVYIDLFEVQRVHGVLISPLGDITARLGQLRA
jgi:LacI family transcriptional regulator